MQNSTKERKQPPVVILQQSIFYDIFIRCLWLRIIRRSDQGVYFMNFPSQIFFNDINHGYRAAMLKKSSFWRLPLAATTYCYYEQVRRTMRTVIVSYLLNPLLPISCQYLYLFQVSPFKHQPHKMVKHSNNSSAIYDGAFFAKIVNGF